MSFSPSDPPRGGLVALYRLDGGRLPEAPGDPGRVSVVTDATGTVREVSALLFWPERPCKYLLTAPAHTDSARARAFAVRKTLELIAAGCIAPGLDADGVGAWRIAGIDGEDAEWLHRLADAMPTAAFAVTGDGRLPDPYRLLRAFLDAVADSWARGPAVAALLGEHALTADDPVDAPEFARTRLGGSVTLAIEEPELSQHRSQERVLACSFQEIATEPTSNVQVMYVTHSPNFIDPQQFQQLRRVVSEPGPKGGRRIVVVRDADPLTVDDGGQLKEDTARKTLGRMNPGELAEACFERAAIIVEGVTERAILRGITARPGQRSLDEEGITIVVAAGKEGIPAAHAVLMSLGIPNLVVFDSDGARLDAGTLTAPKEVTRKQTLALLKHMGIDEVDFKFGAITPGLYVLEGDLEAALDRHWPKWQSARDSVVSEGRGSGSKKDFVTYELAARESPSEPTGQLAEIVELARSLN